MKDIKKLIDLANITAIKAGEKILEVYHSENFEIEIKSDNSPLTKADKLSNAIITEMLKDTDIPILSEEGKSISYSERKHWEWLWIVDPLDGTKEFIKKNGEFTVNIALVKNNQTIAGVIYVPVKNELYYSDGNSSYYAKVGNEKILSTNKLPMFNNRTTDELCVVASRSHMNDETLDYIENIKEKTQKKITLVSAGSSLKFCLVATGKAQLYPRYAPTMEWDTAAGHAIVKTAGFNTYEAKTGKELIYNKENLLNPHFVVK